MALTPSPLPEPHIEEQDVIPSTGKHESSDTPLTLADIPKGGLRQELGSLPDHIRLAVLAEIAELAPPQLDLANSIQTTRDGHLYYVCSDEEKSNTTARLQNGPTTIEESEQSISSWNADPDADNLTNFEEFFYYGHPMSPDNPFQTFNPLNFNVPFGHNLQSPVVAIPVRYGLPDVEYIIEQSRNLRSWEEIYVPYTRQSSLLTDHDGRTYCIIESEPDYFRSYFRIRIVPTEALE